MVSGHGESSTRILGRAIEIGPRYERYELDTDNSRILAYIERNISLKIQIIYINSSGNGSIVISLES